MNKKVLKEVLVGLEVGQEVDVTFRGAKLGMSGHYKVVANKRGRGKKGSQDTWLAAMFDLPEGSETVLYPTGKTEAEGAVPTVCLRTKLNDEVLNISVNGVLAGSADESAEVKSLTKDKDRAKEYMTQFSGFVPGTRVRVTSQVEPSFNGEFEVLTSKASPGRFGQRVLTLKSTETDSTIAVWSYRHSAVVDSVEVLSTPTAATEAPTAE